MNFTLKNNLAACLAERGIRQWQLARRLHMSRAYVCRLCGGSLQPSITAALRIAKQIGKPVEQIFQLVEVDNKNNFPSVPGCGQEFQMTPETTTSKRKIV